MVGKQKIFDVKLPILNMEIEIQSDSLEKLKDKRIKIDLTRFLKGKSVEAIFIIHTDKEAIGEIKKLRIFPFYIRRMIRKDISYVEDSFKCKVEDASLKIKPFLITRRKVHRSVRKALRNRTKSLIEKFCQTKKADDIFSSIIGGMLQRELSFKLKKIYPLSFCDIRVIEKEK